MRFSAVGVVISSAEYDSRRHAYGLAAATREKPAHISPITRRCSSSERPESCQSAFSNSG